MLKCRYLRYRLINIYIYELGNKNKRITIQNNASTVSLSPTPHYVFYGTPMSLANILPKLTNFY